MENPPLQTMTWKRTFSEKLVCNYSCRVISQIMGLITIVLPICNLNCSPGSLPSDVQNHVILDALPRPGLRLDALGGSGGSGQSRVGGQSLGLGRNVFLIFLWTISDDSDEVIFLSWSLTSCPCDLLSCFVSPYSFFISIFVRYGERCAELPLWACRAQDMKVKVVTTKGGSPHLGSNTWLIHRIIMY